MEDIPWIYVAMIFIAFVSWLKGRIEDAAELRRQRQQERRREKPAEPLVRDKPPANPTLEVIERAYIEHVLRAEGGNKSRAAEVLGIDPSTLYRKIKRYELDF